MATMRRTFRIILIATALMTCAVIAPVLLNFSSLYARVYDDRRFPALSRYALEPTPGIVRECLDGVCAAFELVDDRGADYARLDACSLVADNSWNAGLVHGRFVAAKDVGDILGREGVLTGNGAVIGQGLTDDVGGDPLRIVAWLETHLRSKGRTLAAGEWVSTGSIVPTHFAERGEIYTFEIAGLSTVEISVV